MNGYEYFITRNVLKQGFQVPKPYLYIIPITIRLYLYSILVDFTSHQSLLVAAASGSF